jgi:16S rRNA (cytosine1402-N4)-methyltransferase
VEQARPHTTVLLHEAIDGIVTRADGIYIDGTFGRGGHTRLLLSRLGPDARVIAFDKDPDAVAAATTGPDAIDDPRFTMVHASFAQLGSELDARGIGEIDGLLLDLGISSPQIDTPGRGFSFRFDGPLDMRMDTTRGETAAEFLARADERQIAEVIRDYGEERFAGAIAKAVVAGRLAGRPLGTTAELSHLVAGAVRTREGGQDPATRTFQALRIFVNAELEELRAVLSAVLPRLRTGGRLCVISFHSLEDRIVKTFVAQESREEIDRRAPFAAPTRTLTLRPVARIKPSEGEIRANPRSRSAILRVAERL